MMKITVAFVAVAAIIALAGVHAEEPKNVYKQKFLFEIVYRVEDPLMFDEYIKLGKSFVYHKDDYLKTDIYDLLMADYYKAYKYGVTLPKGEFFGAMDDTHYAQLTGLFGFFYYAKNWEIFQRNVCWARLHANEAMFVQALTLAVIHRDDFHDFMLPTIYEIFPQYFFNSKFVYEAEKFDYNVWSKYIMYEKEYKDLMYTDYSKYFKEYNNYSYFYTKDWKTWQWWKLMGLGEHWYAEDRLILHRNAGGVNRDLLPDVKTFWMPVDYTRDINFFNKESALSYFTEDMDLNAFWYYFNMNYAPFLNSDEFGLDKDRRGEYYAYVLRQLLSRYYMERLSHGYGEIPDMSHYTDIEQGYHPQLIHYNGIGFSYRKNYYDTQTYGDFELYNKFTSYRKHFDEIITKGYFTKDDNVTIDLRKPEAVEFIGQVMQGNMDINEGYLSSYWFQWVHMYFADVDHESYNYPHVFMNYETMMRDPLFYMVYKKITEHFFKFHNYIEPYTQKDLTFPGVTIKDVEVSELVTYFDVFDFDVTNLLNEKMTFVDGEFVWDKTLLARQMRLNHKPYKFLFTVNSDKDQNAVIRTFLAPKYDEFGRVISLSENRENFLEIDKYVFELKSGVNSFERSSQHSSFNVRDRSTYSERYLQIMLSLAEDRDYYQEHATNYCSFPDRLVLPRGWYKGMPMQVFFIVTPYDGKNNKYGDYDYLHACDIGSGARHVDEMALGYPFDREIDEYEFFVPNMFFKDVKIYHEDIFEQFYGEEYADKFGTFDSAYYDKIKFDIDFMFYQ